MKLNLAKATGATLAEFTLFLPIWIICLAGLINLGLSGVESTAVQLTANQNLWKQAINVTTLAPNELGEMPHALPTTAGAKKATILGGIATKDGNDHSVLDGTEAVSHGAALALGHWGEGAFRVAPVQLLPLDENPVEDATHKPEEVLGKRSERPYPHLLLNDQLGKQSFSGGVAQIAANLVSGSGLLASTGAGIRYGDVFASEEREITLVKGAPSFTARAHYDMLVAPQPIHPIQSYTVTFGAAWLMTQSVDYYEVMPRFGKREWSESDGSDPQTGGVPGDGGVPSGGSDDCDPQTENCQ